MAPLDFVSSHQELQLLCEQAGHAPGAAAQGVTGADPARDYCNPVEPRLNYEPSLQMALRLAKLLGKQND